MENILFITNKIFIDDTNPEGGVRLCTYDFINLLSLRYNVIIFPIEFNRSFFFRVRSKIGIAVFEDYNARSYEVALVESIQKNKINKVFLNLSDTSPLSVVVKKHFHDTVKVILCSHGNESVDFLHQTVRFKNFMPIIKRITSPWRLGRVIQEELKFRLSYFDFVLTVSEIELALEYWLGAKQAYYVTRVFQPNYIPWAPVPGRVGFVSDLSHYPNYYGISSLCKALSAIPTMRNVEIRLVGKYFNNIDNLLKQYPFLTYVGYMNEPELKKEVSTWMYYLNLVFYVSKGVSTKLAKGMNWGLPIISTSAGNRGYIFKNGGVVTCSTPQEISKIIMSRAFDISVVKEDKAKVEQAVESLTDMDEIMNELYPILAAL